MNTFLQEVAKYIHNKYNDSPEDSLLVFPNRRSGIFFRKYLAEQYDKPIWSPRIITISDFIQELSDYQPTDRFTLLFDLYDEYIKITNKTEKFDEFFYWGEMLLSDFNDIDKNMVDAKSLFQNLSDLKNIDEHFSYLDEEQLKAIRQFWNTFETSNISQYQQDFITIWEQMFNLYSNFTKKLASQKLAYEGMIFKQVIEKYKNNLHEGFSFNKVSFIGLNALNKCEEDIMEILKRQGKAEFFWDYDNYYLNNEHHEAGKFIRKNIEQFPNPKDFTANTETNFFNNIKSNKNITVYAANSTTGQAKVAYSILEKFNTKDKINPDENAVILPDENLLLPMLHAIPKEFSSINITMGYPVISSVSYTFLISLIELQKSVRKTNKESSGETVMFYHKAVLNVLNHRFISLIDSEACTKIITDINNYNYIYVNQTELQSVHSIFKLIFSTFDDTVSLAAYLKDCLYNIYLSIQSSDIDDSTPIYDKEIIYLLYTTLNRLHDIFSKRKINIEIPTFVRFFKQAAKQISLPFSGEPLSGLQIMGVLETRALDFKNIIILSMNEGNFPKADTASSFIPYNLRKGFGLPVAEYQDSIYAYYFYRLMQRSNNIHLIYDTKTDKVGNKDMSRYLYQLKYDPAINLSFVDISDDFKINDIKEIAIEKSNSVYEKLLKYANPDTKNYLSPSALNTYINCKLKFYFRHIAKLKPDDEVSEEIDPMIFGNILHIALEEIYKTHTNKVLNKSFFTDLLKEKNNITKALKSAFNEVYYKDKNKKSAEIKGRNILVYEIILKYLRQIIKLDGEHAPFTIIALEKNIINTRTININNKNINVKIGGSIDRIDLKEGIYRVIDYKTGSDENKTNSIEALFDSKKNKKYKGIFQLMVYAQLIKSTEIKGNDINMGLLSTKNIYAKNYKPEATIGNEFLSQNNNGQEFDGLFIELLSDIFNKEEAFTQTTFKKSCEYCDYKDICMR